MYRTYFSSCITKDNNENMRLQLNINIVDLCFTEVVLFIAHNYAWGHATVTAAYYI